jgi:CheY-like chemotaxis protein
MKILVADDDALIRRLLEALLTRLGHQVEQVEDGDAAWKALQSSTPPPLAILDWLMPGLSGPDVCKKLRALNPKSRTYVLLLSAKSDKKDVIAGLDAGADDYLVKPFDPMSLLARLRVARRTIAYQQDLQQHISDMEQLLQRHNLLGEMFGKHGRGIASAALGKSGPEADVSPALLAPERINEMLVDGLAEVGLGDAQVLTVEETRQRGDSAFTAWTSLLLIEERLWIDLLLETDETSAAAMFKSMLGRGAVSESELLGFLAETFNLLSTAIKTSLTEKVSVVLAPVIPQSIRTAALTLERPTAVEESRHRFGLRGVALEITVLKQPAPIVHKPLSELHEMDIVAENLPSPGNPGVFLLNQGVVLNRRYIEKLASLAEDENLRVPVVEPSPLAEFFHVSRGADG